MHLGKAGGGYEKAEGLGSDQKASQCRVEMRTPSSAKCSTADAGWSTAAWEVVILEEVRSRLASGKEDWGRSGVQWGVGNSLSKGPGG